MSETAPKSLRLHIALLGRVNAGKSSFLNLITGQNVSITSDIAGTTTDVVEKTQELLPLGPVVWLDTAGFGDKTELAEAGLAQPVVGLIGPMWRFWCAKETKSVWRKPKLLKKCPPAISL